MSEWNATAYHKVSGPQTSWGPHPHLEGLPSPELKQHFIDRLTGLAAGEDPPFTLDSCA